MQNVVGNYSTENIFKGEKLCEVQQLPATEDTGL